MEISLHEILRFGVAFVVLGVFVWTAWVIHRHYTTGSYPIRLSHMMRRLGIGTKNVETLHYETHLPTAARLCDGCTSKVECDAWLTGQPGATAPPAFCPNAQFLNVVANQTKPAA